MKYEAHLRGVPNLEREHSGFFESLVECDKWAAAVLAGPRIPAESKYAVYIEVIVVEKRMLKIVQTVKTEKGDGIVETAIV